jgi:ribosome-binding factor A
MNKQRSGREASQRQLRVGEVLRQRLSDVLHRFDFEPKALKRVTLTVTEVRISPDLRRATAFVMPLGGDNAEAIVSLLNQEVPRLKKTVLSGLHLKYAPDFSFRVDESFDRAAEMDHLLAQNDVQRDLSAGDGPFDQTQEPDADTTEPKDD